MNGERKPWFTYKTYATHNLLRYIAQYDPYWNAVASSDIYAIITDMNSHVVYLIRHGSPHYPVDSLGRRLVYGSRAELTDQGKVQCLHLARRILHREGQPLDILITSPCTRAQQTAAILSREMGVNTTVQDDRLRDTQSTWEGTLADDFMALFHAGKTFDDSRTQETLEELGVRMKSAYDEMMFRFEGKSIGMISHGDPIRALWFRLAHPQSIYPSYRELANMFSLDVAQGLRLQRDQFGAIEPNIELISGA